MKQTSKNVCKLFLALSLCLPLTAEASGKFKFNSNGKFKVMQVTDSHVKVESEHSLQTVEMLNRVLDAEKPDLVIFTGDVVTGKTYKGGLDLLLKPVVSREIPWALLFGNHDYEQDLNYEQMADLIQSCPGNVGNMKKLKNVSGYGNYVIEVKDREGKKTQAVLYCMDSGAYSPLLDGYAWFAFNQIAWYRNASDRYTKSNHGTPLPALAFFHIPLQEYQAVYTEQGHQKIGDQLETVCAAQINSGMFAAMLEKGDVMGTFVGHDHVNDYIFNYHGIALAYGRFSGSKTTYDKPKDGESIRNGARIIELTEGQKGFDTWIRLNDETVIHRVKFPDELPAKEKRRNE